MPQDLPNGPLRSTLAAHLRLIPVFADVMARLQQQCNDKKVGKRLAALGLGERT
jgi:hypothetical protein